MTILVRPLAFFVLLGLQPTGTGPGPGMGGGGCGSGGIGMGSGGHGGGTGGGEGLTGMESLLTMGLISSQKATVMPRGASPEGMFRR